MDAEQLKLPSKDSVNDVDAKVLLKRIIETTDWNCYRNDDDETIALWFVNNRASERERSNSLLMFVTHAPRDALLTMVPYVGELYAMFFPYKMCAYFHFFVMTSDRLILEDYVSIMSNIRSEFLSSVYIFTNPLPNNSKAPYLKLLGTYAKTETYEWFVYNILPRTCNRFVAYDLDPKYLKVFLKEENSFKTSVLYCVILIRTGMYSRAKDLIGTFDNDDVQVSKTFSKFYDMCLTITTQSQMDVLENFNNVCPHKSIFITNGFQVVLNLIRPKIWHDFDDIRSSTFKLCFETDEDISVEDFIRDANDKHVRYMSYDKSGIPHIVLQTIMAHNVPYAEHLYNLIGQVRNNLMWDNVIEDCTAYFRHHNKSSILRAINSHYCVSVDLYDKLMELLDDDYHTIRDRSMIKNYCVFRTMY